MSSEWTQTTLGDVCLKITDGAHASPKSVAVGKPMASVKDMTRFGIDLSSARLISVEDYESLVKQGCRPEIGDVLIAKDGNSALDTVCNVKSSLDAVLLSSVAILRPNPEKIDTDFLKFYLSSSDVLEYLKSTFISGAAIPRVVLRDFKKAEVNIPPLSIQKEIATVLNAIEDRIFTLRETNSTLEAIAQALFKSWFVDFDPVHAKMQGRAPQGMDEATAALFPDSFEDSALGPVPKGWHLGKLAEIASLKGGKMLDKASFSENGEHPVFGGAGVMGYSSFSNAEGFVITVGRVGAYCGQYFWHQGKAWINNNASLVSPSNPDHSCWLFLWLKSVDMDLIKKGAAQPFVSNGDISELKIVLPPNQIIEEFVQSVDPIFQRLSSVTTQIKSLESLRDTLLPRLISGQLRVSEPLESLQ